MLYNAANSTTLCAAASISLNEHQLKGVDEKKKGGQQFDASAASSTCVGQEGDR